MKFSLRLVLACTVSSLALGSMAFAAEQHVTSVQDTAALLGRSSQSYLGVYARDIDNDRASTLKLKDVTGAEVIAVDHDGPAGKAGLHPHDVILQMNGQPVAGEEALRRMIHETPAGRTVNLVISRDGQQKTIPVQLADRDTIEQDAWSQHMVVPAPGDEDDDGDFVLEGPTGHGLSTGNGFFGAFSLGSAAVGVELDVLGSQLADYFGVKNGQGLLVKHVADDSPAAKAGLKAGDVIITANGQPMATLNEWMKMLHANKGKQVQLTLVRNRKEQTVTLDAANGKSHSELILPEDFQPLTDSQRAQLNDEIAEMKAQIDPEAIRLAEQAAEMNDSWKEIPSITTQALKLKDLQPLTKAQQAQLNTEIAQLKTQIDPELLHQQVQQAIDSTNKTDWKKLQQEAEQQAKEFTRNNQQFQQQMEQLKKSMQDLQTLQLNPMY